MISKLDATVGKKLTFSVTCMNLSPAHEHYQTVK